MGHSAKGRMKILYHIPGDVVGGAETQVQALINNLPQGCHTLVTAEKKSIVDFASNTTKADLVYLALSPNTLIKKIEEYKPDIIQFFHSPYMYGAIGRVRHRSKVVEVAHNRTSFGWDCSTYGKDQTDMLVCVSPDAEAHFLSKRSDCRTIVIPNGIDSMKFYPPKTKRKSGKRPLGGFCGRLEGGPGKGVEKLVEIVRELDIDFELVGYDFGNYGYRLKGTNIKVLPFTSDVTRYYHKWDFFVSCSPKEGFGLAIAEALACGLPSVIYDCGGVCHYLKHKVHAYIAKTYEDVTSGILEVVGGEAYSPTSIDLSAKTMAVRYHALYESLLAEGVVKRAEKHASVSAVVTPQQTADSTVVLGVVPEGWYGIRHALESRITHMSTPEASVAAARRLRPKQVVFGGFMDTWLATARHIKSLGCEVVATWHSTPVLDEFGEANRRSMAQVIDATKAGIIDYISTPHEGMAKALSALPGVKAVYEPNRIIVPELIESEKLHGLNIGLFGTGLPWKNVDTQIFAAAIVPGITNLHLQNLKSTDLVSKLGVPYVVHPYMKDRNEFYQLASSMQINLAVGITETFGYFAAESYLLGVPSIFSSTTPSMRGGPSKATVSYIDDPSAIADAVSAVMGDYDAVLEEGQAHIKKNLLRGEAWPR